MNRFTLLALGLIALFATTSCGDQDIADPNNPDANSPAITIDSLALGMESVMRQSLATYLQSVGTFGREIYFFQGADPRFTGELLEGPIDAGGFLLERPWEGRYRCIRDGNILLARLPETNLNATQQSAAAGFAKTIMAHQFLINLTYTWDNGIIIDVTTEDSGPFVDRAAALTFISNLLDEANADLQNGGGSFPWSLTAGFAAFDTPGAFSQFNRGLKARVAAYSEDWNGVLTALDGSFIDTNASMLLGAYNVFSLSAGDVANPIWEDQNASLLILHGHPSTQTDAEPGDQRFSQKLNVRSETTVFDSLSSNLGVTTAASAEAPFPILRNEELILLRAEANINLGNLADAEADLNAVRAVAGLDAVTLTDTDSAIDQMLHERRYSLFHEGHRWVDMRRYGKLGELPIDRGPGDAGTNRGPDIVIPMMPRPSAETQ